MFITSKIPNQDVLLSKGLQSVSFQFTSCESKVIVLPRKPLLLILFNSFGQLFVVSKSYIYIALKNMCIQLKGFTLFQWKLKTHLITNNYNVKRNYQV